MNREIFLHIKRYESQWGPVILDPDCCDRLLGKAMELGLAKAKPGQTHLSTDLRAAVEHPGWKTIFDELEKLGWTPYYGYPPPNLKASHFQVRTIVTYEETEIEAADLLCLSGWAEWCICGCAGRHGRRWIGTSERVGRHSGDGWDQTHGRVDGWHNYFIHPKVRSHFEKAGLRLLYHPLEWDKPELAQGEFWEVGTSHIMPPCLNDMITWEDGARVFEDGGCEPVELRFRRAEVEAMSDFDAAWTREEVGKPNDPRDGGHHLIVSQRFRRACLDYPLEHVSFVPVRLVDS